MKMKTKNIENDEQYRDNVLGINDGGELEAFTWVNYVHEDLVKTLPEYVKPGGSVLDLGACTGRLSVMLREAGYDVTAADYHHESFVPVDIPCYHVDFDVADSLEKVFKDRKFDAIVCVEVIEHLKNPFLFIEKISELVNDGGYVFITTPNVVHPGSRITLLVNGNASSFGEGGESIGHINPIFPNTIKVAFKCASLEYVAAKGIGALNFLAQRSFRGIIQWILSLMLRVLMRNVDNKHAITLFIGRRIINGKPTLPPGVGTNQKYSLPKCRGS